MSKREKKEFENGRPSQEIIVSSRGNIGNDWQTANGVFSISRKHISRFRPEIERLSNQFSTIEREQNGNGRFAFDRFWNFGEKRRLFRIFFPSPSLMISEMAHARISVQKKTQKARKGRMPVFLWNEEKSLVLTVEFGSLVPFVARTRLRMKAWREVTFDFLGRNTQNIPDLGKNSGATKRSRNEAKKNPSGFQILASSSLAESVKRVMLC